MLKLLPVSFCVTGRKQSGNCQYVVMSFTANAFNFTDTVLMPNKLQCLLCEYF